MKIITLISLLILLVLSSCASLNSYEKLNDKIYYLERTIAKDKAEIIGFTNRIPVLQDSIKLLNCEIKKFQIK